MDEVGRGALCGPVVACVVVLGDGFDSTGVDDSKRLTAKQREELSARVREKAPAFSVGVADPREIDRLNILRATHLAMVRAVQGLGVGPDVILVDALTVPGRGHAPAADREGRRAVGLDRGRLDRGQGACGTR